MWLFPIFFKSRERGKREPLFSKKKALSLSLSLIYTYTISTQKMRKSRAVIAVPKKKTVSFAVVGREGHSHHHRHHRTPFGEVTNKKNGSALTRRCDDDDDDDDGEYDDDHEEPDSPMTVRRKWNKEHGLCDENKKKTSTMKHSFASPSNNNNARFKATAMDKVLILQRRVESLEVRV